AAAAAPTRAAPATKWPAVWAMTAAQAPPLSMRPARETGSIRSGMSFDLSAAISQAAITLNTWCRGRGPIRLDTTAGATMLRIPARTPMAVAVSTSSPLSDMPGLYALKNYFGRAVDQALL